MRSWLTLQKIHCISIQLIVMVRFVNWLTFNLALCTFQLQYGALIGTLDFNSKGSILLLAT